jgi:hypothetical protein
MKIKWLGLGFGAALTLAGVTVPAVAAQADASASCPQYPAAFCTSPSTADGPAPAPVTKAVVVSSNSLAFTGADIEEMTLFGAGALVVGGTLVRRSRRRRTPA